ncbi:MAG: hypothetical protein AAF617_12855 [Bacteroidota bacterium]
MKTEFNIQKIIIASLLFVAWTLPSYVQFSHVLEEDHSFTICHEHHDHLHEYSMHCDMCDYQFSSFTFEFENYPETIISPIISQISQGAIASLCYYSLLINTQLRAPPVLA